MDNKKSFFIKLAVILSIVCAFLFIKPLNLMGRQMIMTLSMKNIDAAKGYILSFGIWAPVVSFMLMILQSVVAPIPAWVITFANANLFGWFWGAVLSWTSAMAGAALCYYIAKLMGRGAVEKLTSKFALEEIDKFFEKHGKYAILIARLLPFVSFDIVSYAAGLTSMSFWSFFWATGLGQLPATIIYSIVGGMLTGGAKIAVMGIFILFALFAFAFMLKKIWNEKKAKEVK